MRNRPPSTSAVRPSSDAESPVAGWPLLALAFAALLSRFALLSAGLLFVALVAGIARTSRAGGRGGPVAAVAALTVFMLSIGFTTGAIEPSLTWLESEGRWLISLGLLAVAPNLLIQSAGVQRRTANWAVGVTALGLLVAYSPLRSMARSVSGRQIIGFTSSHHAAAFLMIFLLAAVLVRGARGQFRHWLPVAALLALALLLTTSRTSLLGVAGGVLLVVVSIARQSRRVRLHDLGPATAGLALCALVLLSSGVATGLLPAADALRLPSIEQIQTLVQPAGDDLDHLENAQGVEDGRTANVLLRLNAWARATNDFTQSPIVGTGPGRFNDADREATTVFPGVRLIFDAERRVDDFGAHNVYLQVAAELGLVGLVLLSWIWLTTYRWMQRSVGHDTPGHYFVLFTAGFVMTSGLVSNSPLVPGLVVPLLMAVGVVTADPDHEPHESPAPAPPVEEPLRGVGRTPLSPSLQPAGG